VGVLHDLALLYLSVLLKQTRDLILFKTRVDTGDKEVRAGVDGTIVIVLGTAVILRSTATVATVRTGIISRMERRK